MSAPSTSHKKSRRRKRSADRHAAPENQAAAQNQESPTDIGTPAVTRPPEALTETNNRATLFLGILAGLAVIHALYFGRAILFPVALAIVLFFLLAPMVRFITRIRVIPESVSAAIVVLSLTLFLGISGYILSGPVSQWFASAPETFREAEAKLQFLTEPVERIDDASEEVTKITNGTEEDGVVEVAIKQPSLTNYLLSATMNFFAGATITVVLVYLLLAMGHRTLNSVVELMPTMEDKRGFVTMIRDVEQGISSYLITITGINIGLGIAIGTGLGLLGMPDPLLLGLMATTLNFIPFVGCVLGSAITFLIGIVYLDTPAQAVAGFLIYFTINVLEGNVVTPLILGRSMKLNPAIVFLFIVFWGWAWGIGGILISVPLLGILKIVCDHSQRLQPVARFLSG